MPSSMTGLQRPDPAGDTDDSSDPFVSEETLVVRNYDGTTDHEVTVQFRDPDDELVFCRTYTLDPLATVVVCDRLDRGVYRVEAQLEDGAAVSADCLVGSGPDETALIEAGNGVVSVTEGL